MNRSETKKIQTLLGDVEVDGWYGPKTEASLGKAQANGFYIGRATSFADPGDVERFRRCKKAGGTDNDCFQKGDNGIGLWNDDTSQGSGPSCAIPPDDMIVKWGGVLNAKHRKIVVELASGKSVICTLKDRLPWKRNIHNGAVIDLNPDAVTALGYEPKDFDDIVKWWWYEPTK